LTRAIIWDVYIINPEEFENIIKVGWNNIRKRKTRMLVNTNIPLTLIPMNIAKELNLTLYDKISLKELCDREITCWRSPAVFAINVEGELKYALTFTLVLTEDLYNLFPQLKKHNIDGILGRSTIASFNVSIDTKTGKPKRLPYLII